MQRYILALDQGTTSSRAILFDSEQNILAIRQHVGMVFQNPDNQIVSNVVEEDVAFAPENLGVPSEEIRRRGLARIGPWPRGRGDRHHEPA